MRGPWEVSQTQVDERKCMTEKLILLIQIFRPIIMMHPAYVYGIQGHEVLVRLQN